MRFVKFIIAVWLLPACAAVTLAAVQVAQSLFTAPGGLTSVPVVAFGVGYGLWMLIFALLPKPTRTYVLGHELTHAIWALMMGARVGGLKVGKTGGQVKTSKNNWLITLVPYFFPFYAILFAAVFLLAHMIWGLTNYMWILFFLVGLGWSFHVTFTLMILLTVPQPDVKSQGFIFSGVVIYLINVLVIALTIALLSRPTGFPTLFQSLGQNFLASYGWTLDKLVALWHSLASHVFHS